jgi:hypothetical protein
MAVLKMTDMDFAIRQIKTDGEVSPQAYEYLIKLAKDWGVAVTNIAWLANKPYPMQGALYQMLKGKCEKEGLVVKSMLAKPLQRAEATNKRAGFEGDIVLFDQKTFDDLMKKNSIEKMSVEAIREMKEMLTHHYREEGWASLETVRAPGMQNPDYLNHMAATRAIDRTLRMIVRCPFTAESEMPQGAPGDLGWPSDESLPTAKPGGGLVPAPAPEGAVKPAEPAPQGPPTQKPISQKPIKKIDEKKDPEKKEIEKKEGVKLSEKQIDLAILQWEAYCKDALPGIEKKQVDDKRGRLLRALFAKDRIGDLSLKEFEEFIGMLTRKEIEITPDQPPASEPEKTEIKT